MRTSRKKAKSKTEGVKIVLRNQYLIKSLMFEENGYRIYRGIDQKYKKYINIYVKIVHTFFTLGVKGNLSFQKNPPRWKEKYCPPYHRLLHRRNQLEYVWFPNSLKLWSITQKDTSPLQEKNLWKNALYLSLSACIIFLIQLKLLKRIDDLGFVIRNLNPDMIVCHNKHEKTQLFILNVFAFEKKNTSLPPIATKYCSVGAHLGISKG